MESLDNQMKESIDGELDLAVWNNSIINREELVKLSVVPEEVGTKKAEPCKSTRKTVKNFLFILHTQQKAYETKWNISWLSLESLVVNTSI